MEKPTHSQKALAMIQSTTSLKDDVYELDIIVNAKNTNSTIDDQFTLVVDHILKDFKETANLILNFATDLNDKTVLTSNLKTQ